MIDTWNEWRVSHSNTSPRSRGEVGAKRRVRGTLNESNARREAPHPDLLPAKSGEKEKRQRQFQERHTFPCHTGSPDVP